MTLCEACLSIDANRHGSPGHGMLRITDTQRIKAANVPAHTVSTFICRSCGTHWTYREGKSVENQGWSRPD
jgi:hypothetical protein